MPHAEIVDGDADSSPSEPLEHFEREIDVLHGHAFGDLQLERLRIDLRLLDRRLDVVDQRELAELARGQIHGDAKIGESHVPKRSRLQQRRSQNPIADEHDESAVLRDGEKTSRRHQAALGMPPSQQCFHTDDAHRADVDLRLIIDLELVPLHRLMQSVLQRQALVH